MSITTSEQTQTLRLSRLIKFPRSKVFNAWITPEDIKNWFGPSTCQVLSSQFDPRVGGAYHIHIRTEGTETCEAGEMDLRGVMREFNAPSRLAYTWNWSGRPDVEIGESIVTIDFLEADGFTQLQLTHEGLPDEESLQDHEYGWTASLDRLEKYLAESAEAHPMPVGEFSWNELLASDVAGAAKFYGPLFGWQAMDFPVEGIKYTILKKGDRHVAGLMKVPDEQVPPQWLAYVTVSNVDATAKEVTQLGGTVVAAPFDVPTVGRIAVFKDPQGAVLGLFQPLKSQ